MGNLKEVRTRIASVSSTQQITSAMKMVSAAKFRRAQNAIVSMRPYDKQLSDIIRDITVEGPFVTYELKGLKDNLHKLLSNIGTDDGEKPEEAKAEDKEKKEAAKALASQAREISNQLFDRAA